MSITEQIQMIRTDVKDRIKAVLASGKMIVYMDSYSIIATNEVKPTEFEQIFSIND